MHRHGDNAIGPYRIEELKKAFEKTHWMELISEWRQQRKRSQWI